MELLHILFMTKLNLVDQPPSFENTSAGNPFKEKVPSEAVLRQWKFIVDIFIENGFI